MSLSIARKIELEDALKEMVSLDVNELIKFFNYEECVYIIKAKLLPRDIFIKYKNVVNDEKFIKTFEKKYQVSARIIIERIKEVAKLDKYEKKEEREIKREKRKMRNAR